MPWTTAFSRVRDGTFGMSMSMSISIATGLQAQNDRTLTHHPTYHHLPLTCSSSCTGSTLKWQRKDTHVICGDVRQSKHIEEGQEV